MKRSFFQLFTPVFKTAIAFALIGFFCSALIIREGKIVSNAGQENLRDRAEAGLRKALGFYTKLQYGGGWASLYSADLTRQWGEWLETHKNVITIAKGGTNGVGQIFLKAMVVLNEPSYLQVARNTGDLLVAGQQEHGGFSMELQITDSGIVGVHQNRGSYPELPSRDKQGFLEDYTTDGAIEILLLLWDATNEMIYFDAARKSVDFLITAQYPSGGFPQRYPPSKGYDRLYTLNDGATTDPILRLISFYRRTGEQKYLDAALKGGDWLLSAVLPDPTPAWAEQYDMDLKPAKARIFEPPGASTEMTFLVIEALTELHLVSGNPKYLAPIPDALAWLESIRLQDGRWYRLYDLANGKPLFPNRNTGDIFNDINQLPEDLHERWYIRANDGIKRWEQLNAMGREKLLLQRLAATGRLDIAGGYNDGNIRLPIMKSEEELRDLTARVESILAGQNPSGYWIGSFYGADGISSGTFVENATIILTYLYNVSMKPAIL